MPKKAVEVKVNNNVYIWYSGATDKTGKKLMEELGVSGGTSKPTGKSLILGWGAKVDKDVSIPSNIRVLNHPNKIRLNRNKFNALVEMKKGKVSVEEFVAGKDVLTAIASKTNPVHLPLVGRTNFHQGGAGFWLCLTKHQVDLALNQGAQYFQNYIDIKDEFRLHIIDGKLVYAQKKTVRDNMEEAFIQQTKDSVMNAADRKGTKVDEATLNLVASQLAKGQQKHADLQVRSNKKGYKFSSVKESSVNKNLLEASIAALKALDLQFGAVDCCLDTDGKAWVIEVNSGPGLEGTSLELYKKALGDYIDRIINPKKATVASVDKPSPAAAKSTSKATGYPGGVKAMLAAKTALMQQMVDAADDNEATTLESVFSKMFK